MTNNAERLRALMQKHRLTRPATAELAGVSKVTVDSWLAPQQSALHRSMPDRALKLVELQLKSKRPMARKAV